jgi:pyridinium-3,5-bisthiocarboxylic acid mononucleotide nickel chelatase
VTRVAYLDCVGGLAGDMVLGALLDAGAPPEALHQAIDALGLTGVKVEIDRVARHGIGATHVRVDAAARHEPRPTSELLARVADADLSERVRARSLDALGRLADVEGGIHGEPADAVVLHELGGDDTLVDICGSFALLEALGVARLICSPLPYARGLVAGEHGAMPAPAPAVLGLLPGAPFVGVEADHELVTPTGAAIAAVGTDGFGELPPLQLEAVGYGTGTRDPQDRPNLLRVVLGAAATPASGPAPVRDALLLEANLDDLLPELIPDAIEACVAAGALDVWTTPVQMKKGRPGVVLSAVARPDAEGAIARALLEHTSSLGVRVTPLRRYELDREIRRVDVEGHPIRVKVALRGGRVVNVAPEHDDCAAVAAALGRPVKQVWAAALMRATAALDPREEP